MSFVDIRDRVYVVGFRGPVSCLPTQFKTLKLQSDIFIWNVKAFIYGLVWLGSLAN